MGAGGWGIGVKVDEVKERMKKVWLRELGIKAWEEIEKSKMREEVWKAHVFGVGGW